MAAKAIIALCAQALLIQSVFSQCTTRAAIEASGPYGRPGLGLAAPGYAPSLAYDGFASPFAFDGLGGWTGRGLAYESMYPAMVAAMEFTPTSGGGLPVTSSSAVAPTGISIVSDNAYEGILAVTGELPFVGTTAMEGTMPSVGAGAINHGCGNGLNAMTGFSDRSTPASVATNGLPGPYGVPAYGSPLAPALGYNGLNAGYPYDSLAYSGIDAIEYTPTSGGALPVASASAASPSGIVLASETVYEGPLAIAGELPFVGTVGLEGVLPTAGAGAVNHACGNGINAMVSERTAFAPGYPGAYGPAAYGSAYGPAMASGYGYPAGFAGRGCGCSF